jgi:hypothetical protein
MSPVARFNIARWQSGPSLRLPLARGAPVPQRYGSPVAARRRLPHDHRRKRRRGRSAVGIKPTRTAQSQGRHRQNSPVPDCTNQSRPAWSLGE